MKYEEMSDFEINKSVARLIYGDLNGKDFTKHLEEIYQPDEGEVMICYLGTSLDYCNNPSDAWPIIFENKISLDITDTHTAAIIGNNHCYIHKNPLRAAMIVFLMMQESDK